MHYMGGKARIAKQLTTEILAKANSNQLLIEPFIGGGWVTAQLAPHFNTVQAYDLHEDLVLMWQQVLDGTFVPPTETSREEYMFYKNSDVPSALRGFLGFGMSYAGKWFGGYTGGGNSEEIAVKALVKPGSQRDYIGQAGNGLLRKAAFMGNVEVARSNFFDIEVVPGSVLYCDPPYARTTGYSSGGFDSERFWVRCSEWAEVAQVFVSEENAPADWESIWSKSTLRSVDSNSQAAVEHLFYRGPESVE